MPHGKLVDAIETLIRAENFELDPKDASIPKDIADAERRHITATKDLIRHMEELHIGSFMHGRSFYALRTKEGRKSVEIWDNVKTAAEIDSENS